MGCSSSHIIWLDGRFTIQSCHTTHESGPAQHLLTPNCTSFSNFNTIFGAPWWITFSFEGRVSLIYGIEIASHDAECSPINIELGVSQDLHKWAVVASMRPIHPWGTCWPESDHRSTQHAIQRWRFTSPICGKFLRVKVIQTCNGKGPSLHYVRFAGSCLPDTCPSVITPKQIVFKSAPPASQEGWIDTPVQIYRAPEVEKGYPPLKNLLDGSTTSYFNFSAQKEGSPWWVIFSVKELVYELCGVEIASYMDCNSPRLIQVEVSCDLSRWELVRMLGTEEPWGSGQLQNPEKGRTSMQGHPSTGEQGVVRGPGKSVYCWSLDSANSIRYPQYVLVSIPQTYSGAAPSLHYIKFFHSTARPRARTDDDVASSLHSIDFRRPSLLPRRGSI